MKIFSCVLLLPLLATISTAQAPILEFQLQALTGPALVQPVDIASAGDGSGRLFIVEKRGTIRIVQNDTVRSGFFLDLRPNVVTTSEAGLLGLAFHPDYPATPYIYVNYVRTGPVTRISRFTLNPDNPNDADESTELVLISVAQPQLNHNAGDLAFGPDGYLYITMGDGGGSGDPEENGQDPLALLGKILRIDVNSGNPYSIPPSNPFFGNQDTLPEIWALGMRNPWRFSFDRGTGDLWIADVGQGLWEEINFEQAGSGGGFNYGWDCYEGNASYELTGCSGPSTYRFPIFVYPHSCSQGCPYGVGSSITGGFVYRGNQFQSMQGYYICADYITENIWLILHTPGGGTQITMQAGASMFNALTTFGEDDNGELYAATLGGSLYRVVPEGFLPVHVTHFSLVPGISTVDVRWRVEHVEDVSVFTIERSTDGAQFSPLGTEAPRHGQLQYVFTDFAPEPKINYYRLVSTLKDGSAQISEVRSIDRRPDYTEAEIFTHSGGGLAITLPVSIETAALALYTTDGRMLLQRNLHIPYNEIPGTESLPGGLYVVVIQSGQLRRTYKWVRMPGR